MSEPTVLYERNAAFAATFNQGDLTIKPQIMTVVLTCVDARVDPAHFAGLDLGDALVMRNVGGRVTDAAILEVSMLFELMRLAGGGQPPPMGLAVIQHTDCGMARIAAPPMSDAMNAAFGAANVVETYAIKGLASSVGGDVRRAREELPAGMSVSGHVYDVSTGTLEQIVAPVAAG